MTPDLLSYTGPTMDSCYVTFSEEAGARIIRRGSSTASSFLLRYRKIQTQQAPYTKWVERLRSFQELEEDWDSYGAARIHPIAIRTAKAIIEDLSLRSADHVPFHVAPMPNGGVQMEWQHPETARVLELWIHPTGGIRCYVEAPGFSPRETELPSIQAALGEVLSLAA